MSAELFNPFPGLRPFESDESHLFFGRDGQSDELIRRLARSRFLAVVGTSGSGKSSLVRAGLFPSLNGGLMAAAGSAWRIALFRPGNDPIGNLSHALDRAWGQRGDEQNELVRRAIVETTLRRGELGLVEACQQARMGADENLLVVVDQFEEIFRFKRAASSDAAYHEDADAFIKLLLEASHQKELPIYVILTMRSDFLGDCAIFRGLPEAINDGQYLIPRMTRDERREAIEGPVGVGGGKIARRLVQRLLNDLGGDPDQLPVLQHALMRTWDHWQKHRQSDAPIDLSDYEAIGTMKEALMRHAEEAYNELASDRAKQIAEKLFKCLTEKEADNREIRRPTNCQRLSAVAGSELPELAAVIDVFRRPGRSFLMPPIEVALNEETVIDISHESLIRKWDRLHIWLDEEAESRAMLTRLNEAAQRHKAGKGDLWPGLDLKLSLDWVERAKPNAAWGELYGADFQLAMSFLDQSKSKYESEIRAVKRRRTYLVGTAAAVMVGLAVFAARESHLKMEAENEKARADRMTNSVKTVVQTFVLDVPTELLKEPGNLNTVRKIYEVNDKKLLDLSLEPTITDFAMALNVLGKANTLINLGDLGAAYAETSRILTRNEVMVEENDQAPSSEEWQGFLAQAYEQIGNIMINQGDNQGALDSYKQAVSIGEQWGEQGLAVNWWKERLGASYEAVGNVLHQEGNLAEAIKSYRSALALRHELEQDEPENPDKKRSLVWAHIYVGDVLQEQGDLTGALNQLETALSAIGPFEADRAWQLEVAGAYERMGNLYRYRGQHDRAQEALNTSHKVMEKMEAEEPNNAIWRHYLAALHRDLGDLSKAAQNYTAARRDYEIACKRFEELSEADKTNVTYRADLATCQDCLGDLLTSIGQIDAAEKQYQSAFAIRKQLAGGREGGFPLKRVLAMSQQNLGDVLVAAKNYDDALKKYEEANAIRTELAGRDRTNAKLQSEIATSIEKIAELSARQEKWSAARDKYNEAIVIREELFKKDPSNAEWKRDLALVHKKLTTVSANLRKSSEMEFDQARALDVSR
ncbi:MAG: tetratricopeptide repeat protein [Burkholderiales bacterium]